MLKCIICGGEVEQDLIARARYVSVSDGCHCKGCGIKFKPDLPELTKLFENLKKLKIKP